MAKNPDGLRPAVVKHLPAFTEYLKHFGAELTKGVLKSREGEYKGVRLKVKLDRRDRYQMMQMLDLIKPGEVDET